MNRPTNVDVLILGAGWTSTFLIPLLKKERLTYEATTTTGRDGTLKFKFQHDDRDEAKDQWVALPVAKTILITFPLKETGDSVYLTKCYECSHGHKEDNPAYQFIQLGSSGIWSIPGQELWVTRHSKVADVIHLKPSIPMLIRGVAVR
jgi:hypothetical protein